MIKGNFKDKIKTLITLFLTFFKIGAFTFGGGYAMIPFIEKETVEKRGWIKSEDILDIVAIAESTPGPIAINSATFVGYKISGFFGSFFATLGIVLPSFVIILIISYLLKSFADIKAVQYAFFGIRAGVLALIIKALITMFKKCPKNKISYFVMLFSFLVTVIFDVNVLYVVASCAVIGLLSSIYISRRAKI